METNFSISYIMPNLLLGFCKGARSLKEYSIIFHDQLGYDFFRLELSFLLAIGRNISPDAIVISTKMGNTLMFEWTETSNPKNKQDQLDRYANVVTSDLINIAAVPPAAAKTHDVVLALRPEAVRNFQRQLSANGQSFPILVLSQSEQDIALIKVLNSFEVVEADDFFKRGIQTDRLPRYLAFSLETCKPKEMVPFVLQHLVSLLVKGETGISLPEFCRGFVYPWDFIGIEKRKELSGVAKGLINDLVRKRWGGQLAKRIGDNPPTWVLAPDLFKKNPKGFRKQLNEYIAEVRGENYQPSLDFGPEE